MPEGDTIHRIAIRLQSLTGAAPDELRTPSIRIDDGRWQRALGERKLEAVSAFGKHLVLFFEGGVGVHSHLRMNGRWAVHLHGSQWPRPPRRAWFVLRRNDLEAVQFDGPVLNLVRAQVGRRPKELAHLGPDLLATHFDVDAVIKRFHMADRARSIGDVLLDQRIVAGIGNAWKNEGCFYAGVNPWRVATRVSDDELVALLMDIRGKMQASATGRRRRPNGVYRRAGGPCPRCSGLSRIVCKGQGDDNRSTFWCKRCQS